MTTSTGAQPLPPRSARRLVMLMARAPGELPLGRMVQTFGGHVEVPDGHATPVVVWQSAWTVESAIRMAEALHDAAPEARVGVVAMRARVPRAMAEVRARAVTRVHALSTMAPAGATLLSAEARHVPPAIRCDVYGGLFPDLGSDPVPILRVVAVAPAAEQPPARVVGRDAELSEFRRLVATVAESRRGAALRVQGEAGIGKTHLLDALQRIATEHGFVGHRALNQEHEVARAQSAVAMLLRSLLGVTGGSGSATGLEPAVKAGRLPSEHVPFVRDLLDLPMGLEEQRIFDAMTPEVRASRGAAALGDLLREACGRGPVLVEVEDVHWAPAEVRQALRSIVALTAEVPLVLVLTSRGGDDPVDQAWLREAGASSVHRWQLSPMGLADAQAMAAAILARRRAPWMLSSSRYVAADVVARFVEQSGGHPLLLEQLLLTPGEGFDTPSATSIEPLVASRLATLDAADQRAVRFAAACGMHFDLGAVSAALGDHPWNVETAVAAGLLRAEGRGHRFTHALVRDAVYATIDEQQRPQIHRALAGAMADPGLRADHLTRAGDPEAPRAHLLAARRQAGAGRIARALDYLARGLDLAPERPVQIELLELTGRLHVDDGHPEEAIAAFEQMIGLTESPIERCRARLGVVSALRLQSRSAEAEAPLAEAEALAAAQGRNDLIAEAAFLRGCLLFAQGHVDGCMAQHERAVDHARRAGEPRTEALALSGLGDAYYAQSRIARALAVLERCIEVSRAHGFGRIEVGNLFMMGAFRVLNNEVVSAVRDCIEAAQMAARVGNRRAQMLASLNVGIGLTHRGDTPAALEWIATAARIAEQMNSSIFLGSCWAFEARALTVGGDRARGLARSRAALESARAGNSRFFGGVAYGVVARATDSATERQQALADGEALLAQPCVSHNYFYFYEDALEISLWDQRWSEVERYATAFDRVDAVEPIPRCRLIVDRARALAQLRRTPANAVARTRAKNVLARAAEADLQPLIPDLEQALAEAEAGGRR